MGERSFHCSVLRAEGLRESCKGLKTEFQHFREEDLGIQVKEQGVSNLGIRSLGYAGPPPTNSDQKGSWCQATTTAAWGFDPGFRTLEVKVQGLGLRVDSLGFRV